MDSTTTVTPIRPDVAITAPKRKPRLARVAAKGNNPPVRLGGLTDPDPPVPM